MKKVEEQDVAALSDEELAFVLQGKSSRAGRERAFDELVQRHQGRVYAVAYRITSNREDALDVAQEVFVKVYRKVHTWRPRRGFLAWVMRLTTNQAIDSVRRRKRHGHRSLDERGEETSLRSSREATASVGRELAAQEIEQRVQEALGALSVSQRAVFVMRHYEGMPLAQIAEAMGSTVGSVKVHLFRALRKLRQELKDLYGD